jgi:hypothetical protein
MFDYGYPVCATKEEYDAQVLKIHEENMRAARNAPSVRFADGRVVHRVDPQIAIRLKESGQVVDVFYPDRL